MLIEQLADQGFQVFIEGSRVGVKPACKLTPQLRQLIKNNKQQILAELACKQDGTKTTMTRVRPKEAIYRYHQRPDESDDDYHDRVLDESLNALFH